ncbi:MAG: sulfatase [Armatimonadetes bacterium]|nr:sulfatase [Armatimonadota bacterium]
MTVQRREFIGTIAAASLARRAGSQPVAHRPPNVLFAIADDWSYGHAGAYGCRWARTPAFDRVANEGILFTHAYTPNAKCAPSRACILTGRNPWQLKAAANHWCFFPPEFRTWPEALGAHDWHVGKTAKGWAPGVAVDAQGQPRQMTGRGYDRRTAAAPTSAVNRCDYAGNFADFLDAAPAERPWAFWYGCTEPHRGYEYGSGVAKGGWRLSDIDRVPGCWPDNERVRTDLLDYAFEVEHYDRHLGRMLDLLAERGELDNTLVVVTSDNGMPFPHDKGNTYHDANHLPLAVRWPQGIAGRGRVVDDYVSFVDFAPTFLELAGLTAEQAGMAPTTGRSLSDVFRTAGTGRISAERDHVLLGRERTDVGRPGDVGYPIRGIVRDDALYLRNFEPTRWPGGNPETGYLDCDGSPTKTEVLRSRLNPATKHYWDACFGKRPAEELFDVKADPDCLRNLIAEPGQQARLAQLRDQLTAELTAQADPRTLGQGAIFDTYPYADDAGRGFYERHQAGEKLNAGWVNPSDFETGTVE